ncbi:MAG TPA: phage holin family protein [Polyangia bacterium]|nr:phage holin family protein [Polyangia bacterium]
MFTILHLAVLALTVLALERLLPDVHVKSIGSAVVVAIVFSVLNFFLAFFIKVLLVVPAILTLGLLFLIFPFVVNTILLWLTDKVLRSFKIESLSSLLLSAGAITAVNALLHFGLRFYVAGHAGHAISPGPIRWI